MSKEDIVCLRSLFCVHVPPYNFPFQLIHMDKNVWNKWDNQQEDEKARSNAGWLINLTTSSKSRHIAHRRPLSPSSVCAVGFSYLLHLFSFQKGRRGKKHVCVMSQLFSEKCHFHRNFFWMSGLISNSSKSKFNSKSNNVLWCWRWEETPRVGMTIRIQQGTSETLTTFNYRGFQKTCKHCSTGWITCKPEWSFWTFVLSIRIYYSIHLQNV